MKKILIIAVIAFTVFSTVPSFGATTNSGSAGASVTAVAPVSGTVSSPIIAIPDGGGEDEIVQLNNLRIHSIEKPEVYPSYTIFTASSDTETRCERFLDINQAKGTMIACPAIAVYPYRIRIDNDTRLLLRTRARATISDFQVGDRINVYGFMNSVSIASVDALIARNLDKPVTKQYIQLNNMEVRVVPDTISNDSPFVVVQQQTISPCLDYGVSGRSGAPIPCPLGAETRNSAVLDAKLKSQSNDAYYASSSYYPMARKYLISTDRATQFLDRNRKQILSSAIKVGDKVNIYGLYDPSNGSVKALVMRDLSEPREVGRASLKVFVNQADIMCAGAPVSSNASPSIIGPCGVIYDAKVTLTGINNKVSQSASNEKGYVEFEKLEPGKYVVAAYASGFTSAKQEITVSQGENVTSILLSSEKKSRPILESMAPSRGTVGTQVTLQGRGFGSSPIVRFSRGAVTPSSVAVDSSGREVLTFIVPEGFGAYCPPGAYCIQSYEMILPGKYEVRVMNTEGELSENTFTFEVI